MRLLLLCSPIFLLSLRTAHALWPQPRSLQNGTSALRLAPPTSFAITIAFADAPADLHAAVERTRAQLFADNLARLVPSRGAEDLPALAHANVLPGLELRLERGGAAAAAAAGDCGRGAGADWGARGGVLAGCAGGWERGCAWCSLDAGLV